MQRSLSRTDPVFHDFRLPGILRFGCGALSSLADEIRKRNARKIAVISDKGLEQAGLVQKVLDAIAGVNLPAVSFTGIAGEPTFRLLEEAVRFVKAARCDLVIGIGGGSAMDVAKAAAALADKHDLAPYLSGQSLIESRSICCVLLPTTSGTGSEVTMNAIFGDVEQEVKRAIVSPVLLPDVAIVDPELTLSCPPRVTAASGVDAFTHAIESYVAVRATPLTKMYAEKAMQQFAPNIAKAVHHGSDLDARVGMSWVSVLAGISLANAGVGAVHALAYPLGGKFQIEHGVANALLLPYVFAVTGTTCTPEMVEVARMLQIGDFRNKPHQALHELVDYFHHLLRALHLPRSLAELGIDEQSLPALAKQAARIDRLLFNTPYRLDEEKIAAIYQNAFRGKS